MSRPKTYQSKLEINVTDEQKERLRELAAKRGIDRSALIRRVFDALLSLKDGQTIAIYDKETKEITSLAI